MGETWSNNTVVQWFKGLITMVYFPVISLLIIMRQPPNQYKSSRTSISSKELSIMQHGTCTGQFSFMKSYDVNTGEAELKSLVQMLCTSTHLNAMYF